MKNGFVNKSLKAINKAGMLNISEIILNNIIKNHSKVYPHPLIKVRAQYYLGDYYAVYIESGYDNSSSLNLGITLRF